MVPLNLFIKCYALLFPMREYNVDLDLMKHALFCRGVRAVAWRLSASGRAMHIRWECSKRSCRHCAKLEKRFDDPRRWKRDRKRPAHRRRILWDSKGGRRAGPWHTIAKQRFTK